MKKTFLYLCVVAVLAVVFSSCLGDNESTTSATKTFTVIKKSDSGGVLYAVIYINGRAYITGEGLTGVSAEDAALISYKVNLNYVGGSNIAQADYITVNEVYPKGSQKSVERHAMDTTVNNSPFKSVAIEVADQNMLFSNRWLFQFSAEVKGDQNFDVIFSYNKDDQKDKDGKELPANTAIVDVVLVKTGVAGDGAAPKTVEKPVVVNFTDFRGAITPTIIPSEGVIVKLWFRYIYINPSTKVKDVNYWNPGVGLGFWNETN
ncbi:hypothetical protein CLV62_11421 [Dysgonomonas alginatilytica]|uniref:NigD-like protein n=1 Tax=Dysgonomonas alginatilytica TaxID=1605892 RepID=A0A2V3PQ13_9BACT|nr:hypothetical protein [Dysgonomonas alginatilytica]PXV63304.1 hypothetical protein CLV62_11421 [Dysgonomonas alginatilytica]